MGTGAQLHVESVDVCVCRCRRAPGSIKMGARVRVPVGRMDGHLEV